MKKANNKIIISVSVLVLFLHIGFWSCSNDNSTEEEPDPEPKVEKSLTASASSLEFEYEESSQEITITTNVNSWGIISSGASWITLSETSGTAGETKVMVTASKNTVSAERSAIITVNATGVTPVKISVKQVEGSLYPSYNTDPIPADITGMSSTAAELAANISLGWNLGNTLEAIGGETAWGNPETTKALIDLVKESGFNAVRVPVSWSTRADVETAEITQEWLDRVKEVVQYCRDNDMYVLVNIHWDNGWLDGNINEASKDAVNAQQKAYWEQIATALRDFDEYVMFASANEPPVENAVQMAILNSYHQTFIDAIRSTGGRNAYRTLVIQGPTTDIEKTMELMDTLPVDTVADRMMMEVHYYGPWQFAGLTEDADWGNMWYYWGEGNHSTTDTERNATWGVESYVDDLFALMKTRFVDNGIPVMLGEFGAIRRTTLTGDDLALHLASREYYAEYIVRQARANGMLPFYWDEGSTGNNGFGIFDRHANTVFDDRVLSGLLKGLD